MEPVPPSVSPHIQRVLKNFQTTANRTLQGPGKGKGLVLLSNHEIQQMAKLTSEDYKKSFSVKSEHEHMFRLPAPFPVQQMPVFTPVDSSRSEKVETLLEDENIACFMVGGEKRLCLPQILNTVLREYTLQQINTVCDDLHIFCSRCQPEQLDILKLSGILPPSAPSCGLITKTDAERLCNALIVTPNDSAPSHPSPNSFKVYHECFGKCKGNFNPESYTSAQALCVQCVDCGHWFSTQKFVCHSHKALENRTCHWGFDSANWRNYLLLAKNQHAQDKLQDVLESMKGRFDSNNKYKRKQVYESGSELVKRTKSEDSSTSPSSPWQSEEESGGNTALRAMMSAFQPWSQNLSVMKDGKLLHAPAIMREGYGVIAPSYLHSGPPVLLHPDKVVPHSESSRYESNYAPNVSLAPLQKCKGEDDDEEEEEEDEEPVKKARISSPEPGPSQSYKEWELSESDDSSVERSSQQGDDLRMSPTTETQRALEIELEMIRQALDGNIGEQKEEKDRFLHEFCKLRAKHQEVLNTNIQARRSLKQELASTKATNKEKIQEASERRVAMEKELSQLRHESDKKLLDIQGDKDKLLKDMKVLQERDDIEIGKLIQVNQELQGRLQHYEMAFEQIRVENILMQEKLLQMGINVLDLVKTNCTGGFKMMRSPSGSPPQRSPSEAAAMSVVNVRGYGGGVLPLGVMHSHPNLDMFVKKERDGCT